MNLKGFAFFFFDTGEVYDINKDNCLKILFVRFIKQGFSI